MNTIRFFDFLACFLLAYFLIVIFAGMTLDTMNSAVAGTVLRLVIDYTLMFIVCFCWLLFRLVWWHPKKEENSEP